LGAGDPWLVVDRAAVLLPRTALDREGGSTVAIDYALIAPLTWILDDTHRMGIIESLQDLPVDNLIVRRSALAPTQVR